jgi:ubiquinone/menaquinone biosynthesis C-methylase UbiE
LTQEGIPKAFGFDSVDASENKKFYLDYLDTLSSLDFAKTYKQQSFAAMNAKTGDKVLDVGCGVGDDVLSLAKIVGGGTDEQSELIVATL